MNLKKSCGKKRNGCIFRLTGFPSSQSGEHECCVLVHRNTFFGSVKTGLQPRLVCSLVQPRPVCSLVHRNTFFGSAKTGLQPRLVFFSFFFCQPRLVCSLVQPRLVCSLVQPRLVCCLVHPRLVSVNSMTIGLGTGLTKLYSLYSTREYHCRFHCFCLKQRHRKINRQT